LWRNPRGSWRAPKFRALSVTKARKPVPLPLKLLPAELFRQGLGSELCDQIGARFSIRARCYPEIN
jgi:hypothetical protein